MKKLVSMLLALAMVLTLAGGAMAETKDYSGYTIRIYSNSNSTERVNWLLNAAKEAGFSISIDDNSVISGDNAAIQKANESKDGDVIFGLNETRWSQLVNGTYENLKVMDWTPSWADEVGKYVYPGKAYGLVVQNVLMLYRNDDKGTNGEALHFQHWADIVDSGYHWYRQGKVGGTTNSNINSAMLYSFTDPTRGDVQVSTFYSSSLYGKIDSAADSSSVPLTGTTTPENWGVVDIDDGTYYIAEYIGILDRADRTPEQTEAVKAFAEWFGSAETQTEWSDEFDSFPCNEVAVKNVYGDEIPDIYQLKNCALEKVEGTDMTYAEYVAAHSKEWTNIMTNLGFYWADASQAPAEPDWDNVNWAVMTQAAQ